MSNIATLAYLAGILDSDGHVSIAYISPAQNGPAALSPYYKEIISVGQVQPDAVDLLHRTFGGSRYLRKSPSAKWRPLHRWEISNKGAATTLVALLPYLRLKRRQAELVLKLRAVKDRGRAANTVSIVTGRRTRDGRRGLTINRVKPEVAAEYPAIFSELRSLNVTRPHQHLLT